MSDIKEKLKSREQYLLKLKKEKEKALKSAPEGLLRVNCHGEREQYYFRKDAKDFYGKYIAAKDLRIAKALAQRDYDKKILQVAEQELKAIQKYIKSLPAECTEDIYENLHKARRKLVHPIIKPDEEFIREWESKEYIPLEFSEDTPIHYTGKNELVRSKSEVLIADHLAKEGIPYRYECPLYLKGWGTVYPDFTILDIRTRKEVYWEHLGMVDRPDYLEDNIKKLAAYEKNGIFPGDRLILSFETKKSPINQKIIGLKIEKYLK